MISEINQYHPLKISGFGKLVFLDLLNKKSLLETVKTIQFVWGTPVKKEMLKILHQISRSTLS